MAREEVSLCFTANDSERTVLFLDPPDPNDHHRDRFYRDTSRLQWFAIGHGYEQTSAHWVGRFDQEEYVSTVRYLEKFGWKKIN